MLGFVARRNLRLAVRDLIEGIGCVHIWPMLGWLEIKHRYRRSVLGPFWLTITTGVLVAGLGLLYGRLFNQDTADYLPYIAVSIILWQFLASSINDSCQTFIAAEGYIKQTKLPFSIHVMHVVWRNLIIFGHNLIVIFVVLLIFPLSIDWIQLLFPVGVLLITINSIWFGLLLGLLCARFRDIPLIVGSVVQLAFFLTPVMWKAEMLGSTPWVVELNPFFHLLEVARAPILGYIPAISTWLVVGGITIIGYVVALGIFGRFRARLAYWV